MPAKMLGAGLSKEGKKDVGTFSTMTTDLLRLWDWLSQEGCTHVAIESAGKRKRGKTTKGSRYLRAALIQAAWAASHQKET